VPKYLFQLEKLEQFLELSLLYLGFNPIKKGEKESSATIDDMGAENVKNLLNIYKEWIERS